MPTAQPGKSHRILVVDDDPSTLRLVKDKLELVGYSVLTASAGQQALDLIAHYGLPHLAIVDIVMPGMDGFEFCRTVQQYADVPVIMLTAIDEEETIILSAALPLPLALCDKARAAQIVGNLLSNASNYSPPESEITLRLAPAQEEGFLQVSVIDQGAGISTQDQEKLFSQFFRTTSASLSRSRGAGLGLYITRALVKLHGGRIWLGSVPGANATDQTAKTSREGDMHESAYS